MGGIPIRIRVWGPEAAALPDLLPRCRALVADLEQRLSAHRPDSELARVHAAQGRPVAVDPTTYRLVERALRWAQVTDGAFDPTVGPLIDLWQRAERAGRWPSDRDLQRARARVGRSHVVAAGSEIAVDVGSTLDVGAIAKGYIADRLAERLQRLGARRLRVEVGGDLRLIDRRDDPERFRVGLHDAWLGGVVAILTLPGGGVATSGCTERFVEIADRRACHVVDPRSGRSVSPFLSVTVVAADGTDADALATAVLVAGAVRGLELVESLAGVEAVFLRRRPGHQRRADGGPRPYQLLTSSGLVDDVAVVLSQHVHGGGKATAP